MKVEISIRQSVVPDALVKALSPEARMELHAAGTDAVVEMLQRHVRAYAGSKHGTAAAFGASPTRHYEDGAAAISGVASADEGTVTIPIPGISRAWGDVTIRPGPGKRALTLPRAALAYGRTVAEVRALGWKVFRPKGTNWLMGTQGDDKATLTLLYTLVGGVVQRRDPSLLPPQGEIAATGWQAVWKQVQKVVAKARQGGLK